MKVIDVSPNNYPEVTHRENLQWTANMAHSEEGKDISHLPRVSPQNNASYLTESTSGKVHQRTTKPRNKTPSRR